MADTYDIIIGLEVHVQLKTESKFFCGCSTRFGQPPNTQTCPVCLGHPGVLPVMNRRAFELALRTAVAFDCAIAPYTKWDRKHYYYPDLPKNFQISQYDTPFALGGKVVFVHNGVEESVRLIRIHLEEDAGKLIHDDLRGISRVDLNRTGTPLLEIVSEPDMTSPEQAYEYLNALKLVLQYLEVSDCNMQEGSLRCDANINLKIDDKYTPIAEVKNLNSFKGVENALRYEAERQYREFRKSGLTKQDLPKVTVGWDADRGVTNVQRSKEEAHDYRYFPEPDIPPVTVSDELIARVRDEVGELPLPRKARLMESAGLGAYDADVLIQNKYVADYFEECLRLTGQPKETANFVINDVLRELKERQVSIRDFSVSPAALAELIGLIDKGVINNRIARETVFPRMAAEELAAGAVIEAAGLKQISDAGALEGLVQKVIDENPKVVADYLGGKEKAFGFFMGQVMRATKGQANAAVVRELIDKLLAGRT